MPLSLNSITVLQDELTSLTIGQELHVFSERNERDLFGDGEDQGILREIFFRDPENPETINYLQFFDDYLIKDEGSNGINIDTIDNILQNTVNIKQIIKYDGELDLRMNNGKIKYPQRSNFSFGTTTIKKDIKYLKNN
jgi:hypothetical protein